MVWIFLFYSLAVLIVEAFNGELSELECPDECDCHYFRINWVTDCSDSNLTEIPYSELSLNVYVLDLNSNFIREVQPFPSDIKMRRLQMADNLMTELRKDSFAGLNYLLDADFSGNKINRIDLDTFHDSPGFITLELQDNPLAPVNGPFLAVNTLLYLDISNCGLDYLNPHFFSNITSLTTLDLSGNAINSISNDVFHSLTRLENLKMNKCSLKNITNSVFTAQSSLKALELAGNSFSSIDWPLLLKPLVRLEYLDLKESGLTRLQNDAFNNLTYLRTLILTGNNLENLDVAATIGQKLHQLDTLDLSYCNLQKPLSEDAFSDSTKLRTLYLSGNSLFASDLLDALAPLVKLEKLSLSHCGLSRLPDTFDKFKSLQELDISNNPLNDAFVKLLAPLHNLEYLNMGYSNLSYIAPTSFSKMTSMKRLVLSGNDLNNLEAGLFGNLTHLESLELNFCGLRRPLNATVFFNNLTYTNLKELQFAGNPLIITPQMPLLPKQLSRLEILDLSNCNISYLPPDAFAHTQNITQLTLMNNYLSTNLQFLKKLPKLQLLDVRNNNLSIFLPSLIENNLEINKLKLIGNPWTCECSIAKLWDWAILEKKNLAILEGSTIGQEHVTVGKHKRKNLLICNYDIQKQPMPIVVNKTVPGRRPFTKSFTLTTTNRTWAKYVRESGCEQMATSIKKTRSVRSLDTEFLKPGTHDKNTWTSNTLISIALYGILLIGLLILYYLTKNKPSHIIKIN